MVDRAGFKGILIRAIAMPLVVIILLTIVLLWQIGHLLATERRVAHSDEVIAQAHLVRWLRMDMANEYRGFLLTGDASFLKAHQQARTAIGPAFDRLARLVADNPGQVERLKELRVLFGQWQDALDIGIALKTQKKDSLAYFRAGKTVNMLKAQRSGFDDFIATEEALRTRRNEEAWQGRPIFYGTTIALALALGLLLALQTKSQLTTLSHNYADALSLVQQQAGELKKREEWLATTLHSIGDAVIATDGEGRIAFMNPVAEQLTGWKQEEAAGRNCDEIFRIINEQTRAEVESPVTRVMREGTVAGLANHTLLVAQDGTERPIDDSGAPIRDGAGNLIGVVLVFRDITERKRAANFGEAHRSIVEAIHSTLDIGKLMQEAVDRAAAAFGCDTAAISLRTDGRWVVGYVSGFPQDVVGAQMNDEEEPHAVLAIETKQPVVINDAFHDERVNREHMRKWGVRSVLVAPLIIRDEAVGVLFLNHCRTVHAFDDLEVNFASRLASSLAMALDNARLLEDLQRREWELTEAQRIARVGSWSWNARTDANVVSEELRRIFGQDCPPFRQQKGTMYPAQSWERLNEYVQRAMQTGVGYELDLEALRGDGAPIWITTRGEAVRNADGVIVGLRGTVQDITERKHMEQQLAQSQKMESVGLLAGGIAHEFNNLLVVILGYAEMIEREMEPESGLLPNVRNIRQAAERAATLTRQLLGFARRDMAQPKRMDLNDLIAGIGTMLRPLIGEHIELVTLPKAQAATILADPHQVEQVILNLVVNARDAMPKGGTLFLRTDNVTLDDPQVWEGVTAVPGPYVVLSVSDTGTGMTAEVKARAFEPFYTTKNVGQGTGLGLATCYGIVKQNRGYIWLYSEAGVGTTVKVYLPCAEEAAQPVRQDSGKKENLRGSETVLVVEDEDLVRDMTVAMLRSSGYTVLTAKNGVDALRVAREHAGPIHLVVTDVVMPQMGGKELVERLRTTRSEMQVLFVSGYPAEQSGMQDILPPNTPFLSKPFNAQSLASQVRAALASH
jgi:two-component system cell cycle sensor histidine kinase/response regulator CckA